MSLNYKRPYRWLPWFFALGLTVIFVWFMRTDLNAHQQVWQERLNWSAQAQKQQLDSMGRDLTQQAMLLAQLVGGNQRVVETLRAAQSAFVAEDGTNVERLRQLRQELQLLLQDYWSGMEGVGVKQLNVYLAPGAVNFVRMQQPDRYGDSLSGVRPLITKAFTSGVPTWGVDVARHGSGYRAILPITANADTPSGVIAVLEIGMSSLPSVEAGQTAPTQMAVFLRKTVVEQVLWEQTRMSLNRQSPTTVDDWRLEDFTDPQLTTWWSRGLVPINKQGQLLHSEGKSYIASWWPLAYEGTPLEQSPLAMLVWTDITAVYKDYQSIRKRVIAKWLAALVCAQLLLLLFIRLNRHHIHRLVEQHSEQLRAEHGVSEQMSQRLALALRSSDSGFWEWDIINDKAHFSPEWRQLAGIGPESSRSLDLDEWMSRVHPADKRMSYGDIIRHIKGETPMYENEYRLKVHDGSFKWIFTRGKVVEWTPDGKAAVMLGVYTDITERKNTELISIRQQAALHSLNEIASLSAVDPAEQLQRALSLGARYLGLSNGVLSQVVGDEYRVHMRFSAQESGAIPAHCPLAKTYCSLTMEQQDVVAEDDIPASEYCRHPAYMLSQIDTYIGVPLWVGGEIYGTLSFNSRKTRHHQYDSLDKDFIRLLARWISSVVERLQQDNEKKVILQRFQKLSELLPGFLYQFQLRPDGSSFFPYASTGIKNIFNVSPEYVAHSAAEVFRAIHPDDIGWVKETTAESAARLTPWVASVRVNHPQRGLIWSHVESIPEKLDDGSILWHGYVSDITSLKQTELELQETNSLRKAILDAATIAIISTDTRGIIRTFNRGAELICGYRAEEMIGRQTPLVLHDQEELAEQARQLAAHSGQPYSMDHFELFAAQARAKERFEKECTFVRKDGHRFPVMLTVTPIHNGDGELTGYLGISCDISEKKRIDKMKSEFISTVSHELRTPLTAISGALSIVANGLAGALPEQSERMIHIAHNNSQRLIHLVNDLLDMEKLVAGKMHFDMRAQMLVPLILQSIESNAAFAQQYGVTYELIVPAWDVKVSADQQRLLQVLANYLSNAAKFSPLDDVVTIQLQLVSNCVRVIVSDKGPGVPEDFRARLFQKFSQADASDTRQKGGTGLGLAICEEIIERMGGNVGVSSTPGQGASFYFELPCEAVSQQVPSKRAESLAVKPHLLVVEDNAETAEVLVAALAAQHYDVDCALTGKSALEHLQLRHYDLITLDLHLPDMHGIDIVEHIQQREAGGRNEEPRLPIIIITGAIDEGKTRLPSLVGCDQVFWLQKPLVSGQLEAVIEQALARLAANNKGVTR